MDEAAVGGDFLEEAEELDSALEREGVLLGVSDDVFVRERVKMDCLGEGEPFAVLTVEADDIRL